MIRFILLFILSGLLVGCARYTTPGGPANLTKINEVSVAEAFKREPASPFPVRMAVIRLQDAGYQSYSGRGYGRGQYAVLTQRDIETEADFTAIASMPQVRAVAPLNRMVFPSELKDALQIRQAAAQMRADVILMYTIGTNFWIDEAEIGPLGVITLGTLPNRKARVTSTASAMIIDTRTGYVYGLAETTAEASDMASMWRQEKAIDSARKKAEREAFDKLIPEVQRTWADIVNEYARKPATTQSVQQALLKSTIK